MNSSEELTHAYLEAHPADAARVLGSLPIEATKALLQSTPQRLTVPVLRQMPPLLCWRYMEQLDDAKTVGLLRGVGIQAGVAIIRQFDAERRSRLLAQLPTSLTIAYELLLSYQEGTIGAWMDPLTLVLESTKTAGDMINLVNCVNEGFITTPYVVDQNQRLIGYIDTTDLLRAGSLVPLASLARPSQHRLPAQSLLLGLQNHPGWNESLTLPIIDHEDRLVGAMTYAALQRALSVKSSQTTMQNESENTLATLANIYWLGISSTIEVIVGFLPSAQRKAD